MCTIWPGSRPETRPPAVEPVHAGTSPCPPHFCQRVCSWDWCRSRVFSGVESVENGANLPTHTAVQTPKNSVSGSMTPWPGSLDPAEGFTSRSPLEVRSVVHLTRAPWTPLGYLLIFPWSCIMTPIEVRPFVHPSSDLATHLRIRVNRGKSWSRLSACHYRHSKTCDTWDYNSIHDISICDVFGVKLCIKSIYCVVEFFLFDETKNSGEQCWCLCRPANQQLSIYRLLLLLPSVAYGYAFETST